MSVFIKRDRFPLGTPLYADLAYIRSTGVQYIDTGFKPKYNTRIVITLSNFVNEVSMLFGVRDTKSGTAPHQFSLYRSTTTKFRSDYFGSNKAAEIAVTNERTTIIKNANKTIVFETTITNTEVSSGECENTLYLFALNDVGSPLLFSSYDLESCQIYDGDVLVRDYIPRKNNKNKSVGLWDKVNNEYYGDASGTGFVAGEKVT